LVLLPYLVGRATTTLGLEDLDPLDALLFVDSDISLDIRDLTEIVLHFNLDLL
jgi:hypothetical protein